MYHKATITTKAYYDTIEEMPQVADVYFPDAKEPKQMTAEQMRELSDDGWYTIMHTVNYGVCDHWISVRLSKWVDERFMRVIHYMDKGKTVGYNRLEWSVRLTRNSKYFQSEVWNS